LFDQNLDWTSPHWKWQFNNFLSRESPPELEQHIPQPRGDTQSH
jgi:hypothetical protein